MTAPVSPSAPVAWRWNYDLTEIPCAETVLFLAAADEDGMERVWLKDCPNGPDVGAVAWSPIPAASPAPSMVGTPDAVWSAAREACSDTGSQQAFVMGWRFSQQNPVASPSMVGLREKVARIIDPSAFMFSADELDEKVYSQSRAHAFDRADRCLALLAREGVG